MVERLLEVLGVEQTPAGKTEYVVSATGGLVAIYLVYVISNQFVDSLTAAIIISSMGSSAVLLYAVPHGPSSQPWPVFGGHLVSSIMGVSCAQYMPDMVLAASIAVGGSIGVMYILRCLHAPGGATALSAVIGGEQVHSLGYQLVLTPVLLNVIVILLVAVVFNSLFHWRRYPAYLARKTQQREDERDNIEHPGDITHADFVYALSQLDSFIDASEHDLLHIYELATSRARQPGIDPQDLVMGACYSNGAYGAEWSVRQIVDRSGDHDPFRDMIIYKVIAGPGRRSSGHCTAAEFARWARYEVVRDEENWKRATGSASMS